MNCSDIPEKTWGEVRETLFFYFSRRFGFDNAADLAQETLFRILSRPDYTFAEIADFPKICIGFARHVAHEHRRESAKWVVVDWEAELDHLSQYGPGPEVAENTVLLRETVEAGRTVLNEQERALITHVSEGGSAGAPVQPMNPADRVRLSRARQKLATYLGWKKK